MSRSDKQANNSAVLKEFGGNLAYSWSDKFSAAGANEVNVNTTFTGTWEHVLTLLNPPKRVTENRKTDPGYFVPACTDTENAGNGKQAAKGFFYRCGTAVAASSLVYLDFDHNTPAQFAEDVELVESSMFAMALYTTASHTDEAPRYRVIAAFDQQLTDHSEIIAARYGFHQRYFADREADKASFKLAQPMYRRPHGGELVESAGDRLLRVSKLLSAAKDAPKAARAASDYVPAPGEDEKFALLKQAIMDAHDGCRTNDRGVYIPASPEHAEKYTCKEPGPCDVLLCFPRKGYSAPNVMFIHDTDTNAVAGMTPRQTVEYACAITGVDFEPIAKALSWTVGVTANDDDLADEVLGEIAAKSPTNPAGSLIIDGFIRAGATGLILGESGTGKTTFAGYLSFCIATGASLFGRRKNRVKRGKVVVLGWEGSGEVKEAFDANAKRYLSEEAQAKANDNFEYIDMQTMEVDGQPFDILNIGHQNYLLNMLKGEATAFICDTYMAMTGGKGEENSNSDAAKYMGAINRIAKQAGTVAFVIHHTKKGSLSPRGATALEGAADMCVTLQCPNEQNKSHMNFYVYKVRMTGGVMMKWMYGIKSTPVRIVSKEAIEELAAAEDLWFADSIELDAVVENPDYEFRSGDRAYGFSYDLYLGEAWVPEKAAGDVVFVDSIDEQEATFLMRVKSSPNGVKAEEGRRIYGVEQQRQLAAHVKPLVENGIIIALKDGREVSYKFDGKVTLPTLKESHKAILSLFSNHSGVMSDAEIAKATGIKSVRRGYLLASLVAARMLAEVEDGYIEGNQYPDEDLA